MDHQEDGKNQQQLMEFLASVNPGSWVNVNPILCTSSIKSKKSHFNSFGSDIMPVVCCLQVRNTTDDDDDAHRKPESSAFATCSVLPALFSLIAHESQRSSLCNYSWHQSFF
jgi:hypothetical protein